MKIINQHTSVYVIPYSQLKRHARVVIYGAGIVGEYYVNNLKRNRQFQIVGILDKNTERNDLFGIKIVHPDESPRIETDYFFLAAERYSTAMSMERELKKHNIEDNHIIWFGIPEKEDSGGNEFPKFVARNYCKSDKKIYIFMLPEHGNMGDYLIGYSEQAFFRKYFPDYRIYGVTTDEWIVSKDELINLITPDDIIVFNGGGYFGNLRGDDVYYKDIIDYFTLNTKIFMPNTLTYSENVDGNNKYFINDMKWAKKQNNLHIIFRDENSYIICREYLDNVYYFPDMALAMNYGKANRNTDKILLCLRDDVEKTIHDIVLKEKLIQFNIDFDEQDMYLKRRVIQEEGEYELKRLSDLFKKYKCVITDRLHGMLLAVISNVPCLAFDNSTHKIREVYKWIENQNCVKLVEIEDINNIDMIMEEIIEKKKADFKPLENEFRKMADLIRSLIEGAVNEGK